MRAKASGTPVELSSVAAATFRSLSPLSWQQQALYWGKQSEALGRLGMACACQAYSKGWKQVLVADDAARTVTNAQQGAMEMLPQ